MVVGDLRIGNYVFTNKVDQITVIRNSGLLDFKNSVSCNIDDVKPILVNQYWMDRLNIYMEFLLNTSLEPKYTENSISNRFICLGVMQRSNIFMHITAVSFIHEIQNIFIGLTSGHDIRVKELGMNDC